MTRASLASGLIAVVIGLVAARVVAAEAALPSRSGYVTDEASLLEREQHDRLERLLESFQQRTGNELAVLIVPQLSDRSIERLSRRVVKQWKLGGAKRSGVLLGVAVSNRTMRIEVAEGLTSVLPDALCQRILAEGVKPHFKRQAYFTGIEVGLQRIMAALAPELPVAAGPALDARAVATAAAPTLPAVAAPAVPQRSDVDHVVAHAGLLSLLAVATFLVGWLLGGIELLNRVRNWLFLGTVLGWFFVLDQYAILPLSWHGGLSIAGGILLSIGLVVRGGFIADLGHGEDANDRWWRRNHPSSMRSSSSDSSSSSSSSSSSGGGGATERW